MWFFIRYSTDNSSKEQLADLVGTPYLISKEYSKRMKLHYHILCNLDLNVKQVKELFYGHDTSLGKGMKTLKVDEVGPTQEDFDKAATYTVKDGDFIYSGIDDSHIERYTAESYSKLLPYTTALKELIQRHTSDTEYEKICFYQLAVDIAILRSQYGLEVYKSKIDALILSIKISLNHNVAYELFS